MEFLERLPIETLHCIFLLFSPKELCDTAVVSKKFYKWTIDPELWRKKAIEQYGSNLRDTIFFSFEKKDPLDETVIAFLFFFFFFLSQIF